MKRHSLLTECRKTPNAKDYAALIFAGLCTIGLLMWPDLTPFLAGIGAAALFIRLARRW
jgi:hypothetical protein